MPSGIAGETGVILMMRVLNPQLKPQLMLMLLRLVSDLMQR